MPKYRITAPDGKTYEVNAPDGASQDDVLAYVQQNYQGAQASQAPAQQQEAQAQPQDDQRSLYQRINDFGNNLGDAAVHHLVNLPLGIAQGVMHLNNAQASALPSDNPIRQKVGDWTNQLDSYLQKREQNYQQSVPDTAGSYLGAGVGEVLPWMTGIGELRAAGLLPKASTYAGKLGTLALEGGLMGTAQPVTSGPQQDLSSLITGQAPAPSYASQKASQIGWGAATGPLIKIGGDIAGSIGRNVGGLFQHAINPEAVANKNVVRLLGDAPDTLSKLQNATNLVPGENPSVAQALQTPQAVQIERSLRNNPLTGPSFAAQDNANNQARVGLLQSIAGTDADMAAARDARKQAIDPFVSNYLTDSRPIVRWSNAGNAFDDALSKPMQRGEDFRALQQGQKIVNDVKSGKLQEDDAFDALQELGDSVSNPKAQAAFAAANDSINKNMVDPSGVIQALQTLKNSPLGIIGDNGQKIGGLIDSINGASNIRGKIGTDYLDAVRQEASKLLGNANAQGAIVHGSAKDAITNAIERVAPGYRDYLATYAKASQPINTMEAVGGLLDPNAPGSLNAAGDPQLALSRVKQLLRADDEAKYPMAAAARKQLEGVRDSLMRRTVSDAKISAAGPSTAADLQASGLLSSAIYGPNLGAKGGWVGRGIGSAAGGLLGSMFGPIGTGLGAAAGAGVSDALGSLNARVATRVGQKMSNAQLAAKVLQDAKAKQAAQQNNLLNYYLYGLPAAATTNP